VRIGGPGQPVERRAQEAGVLGVERQARRGGRGVGDDAAEVRVPALGLDLQEESPGADPEHDVGVGPADLHRLIAGQSRAGEERRGTDQDLVGPGETEAAVDQELAAVGGGDRARPASELQAVQRIAGGILRRRLGRLRQGREDAGREGRPFDGTLGRRLDRVERRDGVRARLRDAAVGPPDARAVGRKPLQNHGRVVAALEFGQGVERQGDRLARGEGDGVDEFDREGGVTIGRAQFRVAGVEHERRNGASVGDAQGVTAQDAAEPPCLAAGDRDHGRRLPGKEKGDRDIRM